MKYIIALFILLTIKQSEPKVIGRWKIKAYDAIETIKQTPAYIFGDPGMGNQIDLQIREILNSGEYFFHSDTLIYSDIERNSLVNRRAIWKKDGDILKMTEIDRPYERRAKIHLLSKDSLVISPIIDGMVAASKLYFIRTN